MEEMPWFIEMRHKFLKKTKPRNYTIFVRDIPEYYRNNRALKDFMASCFSEDAIVEACIPYTASSLGKLEANRDEVLGKLEHAWAEFETTGTRPTHQKGVVGAVPGLGETVDSIDTYKEELADLNGQVETGIQEMQHKIESVASIDCRSMRSPRSGISNEGMSTGSNEIDLESKADDSKKDSGGGALADVGKLASDTVGDVLGKAGNLAAGAANMITGGEDGVAHPSGFVSFSKLSTANAALQMVHHAQPFSMEICEAPDPEDSKTTAQEELRRLPPRH